jgi:hypothetical protein
MRIVVLWVPLADMLYCLSFLDGVAETGFGGWYDDDQE